MNGGNLSKGVISQGIKTPIIQPGDNLQEIVISSVVKVNEGKFEDGDIIAVTEAVVAIAQNNFATAEDVTYDLSQKFPGAKSIVVVDPIQSRNRFMAVLKAVAAMPDVEKVYVVLTYPNDEVGNPLISEIDLMRSKVNPYSQMLTKDEFYEIFGKPVHPFTGKNYIEEYLTACGGKGEVILGNDFSQLPEITGADDYLVCSIHRKEMTREVLKAAGAKHVLDMSEIMNASVNGSGYSEKFGLYGTNVRKDGGLKLMPRNGEEFVSAMQEAILERFGAKVEVMIYGDGAFKDPVGGIWELADPTPAVAKTSGLLGTPKEVKLKYITSGYEGKSSEELEAIVAEESKKRLQTTEVTGEASLGTTPRRIEDLVASLSDLTSGSGHRQTPVIYIKNYFM